MHSGTPLPRTLCDKSDEWWNKTVDLLVLFIYATAIWLIWKAMKFMKHKTTTQQFSWRKNFRPQSEGWSFFTDFFLKPFSTLLPNAYHWYPLMLTFGSQVVYWCIQEARQLACTSWVGGFSDDVSPRNGDKTARSEKNRKKTCKVFWSLSWGYLPGFNVLPRVSSLGDFVVTYLKAFMLRLPIRNLKNGCFGSSRLKTQGQLWGATYTRLHYEETPLEANLPKFANLRASGNRKMRSCQDNISVDSANWAWSQISLTVETLLP